MTTLILFDIDGTLFYGHGCGRAATKLAMQEVFGTYGEAETHNFGGRTDWSTLNVLLNPLGVSPAQVETLMPTYDAAIGRHLADILGAFPVAACPGGPELVDALHGRDDVILGLLTGNVSSTAPIKLRSVGYDMSRFRVGAYGSEAPDRFLLPPIALARAEALYGGPIARTVIIGDTPEDVICARSIDAQCIAVASGYSTPDDLSAEHPAVLLESLVDTVRVLDAIFSVQ